MKKWLLTRSPWIYSGLTFIAILYLTLTPQPLPDTGIEWFAGADKAVHGIMFGGLTLALIFDLRRSTGRKVSVVTMLLFATASGLLGGIIENLQENLIPGRDGGWADFFSDLAGAFIAVPLFRPLFRLFFGAEKA